MERSTFILFFILSSSYVVGEDLFWRPNSNWQTPSNWKPNALPCGGDAVSFEKSNAQITVYLDGEARVGSISLPKNGKLVLGKKGRIAFSSDTSTCKGRKPLPSSAKDFVFSPRTSYWECPENWMKKDGSDAGGVPCGRDTAVFPASNAFSYVTSSAKLSVAGLRVRGENVTTISNFPGEFVDLNVTVVPACATQPERCPCPNRNTFCKPTTAPFTASNNGGAIAGAIIAVIVFIVLVVVAVIAVVCFVMRTRGTLAFQYKKDLDEPTVTFEKEEEGVNFDNPIFDATRDFSSVTGTEEVHEPTVTIEGSGEGDEDDLPEKVPF